MTEQTPGPTDGGQPPATPPAAWPPPAAYPGKPQPYPGTPQPAPAYGGWAPPVEPQLQQFPDHPHAEPLPYHLMLRNWTYVWWKPLAGLGMLLVLFLAVQFLVAGVLLLIAVVKPGSFMDNMNELSDLSSITPTFLLLLNLSLGALILATWVTMRVVHRMRPRWLSSVAPKIRWKFFWVCVGLSVIALIAQTVVGLLLPSQGEMDLSGGLNDFTASTTTLALIVLLTTPFQAAGEEYFFRGYLMQAIGSLLGFSSERWAQVLAKWTALLVTSLLFALAHGAQNFPLFFDRFMFGLIAGWLVIRTGGLEAGIALHVLNNLLAFGAALLFGNIDEMINVSEISWWNIPVTLTQSVVFAALVLWIARRMGVQRLTSPPAAAVPAAVPGPAVDPR